MRRVTLGSPGLRVGKSPTLLGLARAGLAGAVADEEKQRPHLLGHALGILAAQHWLHLAHVRLVMPGHGW